MSMTIRFRVDHRPRALELAEGQHLLAVRQAEHRPERFSWRPNQRHIPGYRWTVTNSGHVPHESQHEGVRVMLADFDPSVVRIVSQPFDLYHDDKLFQIPDLMLVHRDSTITIVNVKRPDDAAKPKVREKFARVTEDLAAVGWEHEVWTGSPRAFVANVDALSAYMRPQLALDLPVRPDALHGLTYGEAVLVLEHLVGEDARAYVGAALWRHDLVCDMDLPIERTTLLWSQA
jgi:hypothetical protein